MVPWRPSASTTRLANTTLDVSASLSIPEAKESHSSTQSSPPHVTTPTLPSTPAQTLQRYVAVESTGNRIPLRTGDRIDRAWYGDPNFEFQQGHGIDVTARAKSMSADLLIAADETWGDPKPGFAKVLIVECQSTSASPADVNGPPPPYSTVDPKVRLS